MLYKCFQSPFLSQESNHPFYIAINSVCCIVLHQCLDITVRHLWCIVMSSFKKNMTLLRMNRIFDSMELDDVLLAGCWVSWCFELTDFSVVFSYQEEMVICNLWSIVKWFRWWHITFSITGLFCLSRVIFLTQNSLL
jgi:hypothetical protein